MNKDFLLKKKWLTIFFATILGVCLPLFSGCSEDDDEYVEPNLTIEPADGISIDQTNGATGTFTINSTRDWSIEKPSDTWLSVVPMTGKAGKQEITVTVKENTGKARASVLNITASSLKASIEIRQKSKDGTEDLYTSIAALRDIFKEAKEAGNVTTDSESGTITYNISEDIMVKGIVISDRANSNLNSRAAGYLQDAAGNGVNFRVSESSHDFDMGTQLVINMNGGTLSQYRGQGAMQIGFSKEKVTTSTGTMPEPAILTIDELFENGKMDGKYEGVLVKITGAQFADNTTKYNAGSSSTFQYHDVTSCGINILTVPFSKYIPFKDDNVKKGNGDIIGIAATNMYNNTLSWYVYPRNLEDLSGMSDDENTRCEGSGTGAIPADAEKVTIGKLLESFKDGEAFTGNNYIEGEVIANPVNGNIPDFVVYVADETAGIAVTIDDKENIATALPLGAKVQVYAKDAKFKNYNGLIQFGNVKTAVTKIVEAKPSTPLQPKSATIAEINEGKYLSQLVAIAETEFEDVSKKYNGTTSIFDKTGNSLAVYTRSGAIFAEETVKEGSGTFIGVITAFKTPQILIRKIEDLSGMTGPRFDLMKIEVDKTAVNFEKAGGSEKINVTTTVSWNANSDQSWCTVSPASQTGNAEITITTTANTGAARSATITITDGGNLSAIVKVSQAGESTGGGNEIFFSEYVEPNKGNNKYLEIYNPTDHEIDLSAYTIKGNTNGGASWSNSNQLSGTIKARQTIVFKHKDADMFSGEATVLSSVMVFNGNDPMGLFKGDELIDIIGVFNGGSADFAKDVTLRRKSSVKAPSSIFIKDEWEELPVNDVSGLGSHTMD